MPKGHNASSVGTIVANGRPERCNGQGRCEGEHGTEKHAFPRAEPPCEEANPERTQIIGCLRGKDHEGISPAAHSVRGGQHDRAMAHGDGDCVGGADEGDQHAA